jgi:hypothetical protein
VVWVVLVMLVILALAALVATYVAYPARGQDVPGVPWVGDVLERGVDALPTLADEHSRIGS